MTARALRDIFEPPAEDVSMPSNVVAALARVMAEMGGVAKLTPQERARQRGTSPESNTVSYAYRGIDDIAAAAQPLFGRYGVVLLPNVLSIERTPLTINSRPWENVVATVEWTVYGPGGLDDHLPPVVVVGEGRDNSDKGINKAMTTSFKNLLLRLLCIGDPRDDADRERHETDAPAPAPPPPDWSALGWTDQAEHDAERERVRTTIGALPAPRRADLLKQWESLGFAWPLSRAQLHVWNGIIANDDGEAAGADAQPDDGETDTVDPEPDEGEG